MKLWKFFKVMMISNLMVVFVLLAAGQTWAGNDRYGILGDKAPELNLDTWIDGDGNKRPPLTLDALKGKVVFMYFFQDWCPGCHSHGFPTIRALSEKFKSNSGVAFVAVQTTFEGFGINTPDKLRQNQVKYNLRLPMAHDTGEGEYRRLPKTMTNYRSGGTPLDRNP